MRHNFGISACSSPMEVGATVIGFFIRIVTFECQQIFYNFVGCIVVDGQRHCIEIHCVHFRRMTSVTDFGFYGFKCRIAFPKILIVQFIFVLSLYEHAESQK